MHPEAVQARVVARAPVGADADADLVDGELEVVELDGDGEGLDVARGVDVVLPAADAHPGLVERGVGAVDGQRARREEGLLCEGGHRHRGVDDARARLHVGDLHPQLHVLGRGTDIERGRLGDVFDDEVRGHDLVGQDDGQLGAAAGGGRAPAVADVAPGEEGGDGVGGAELVGGEAEPGARARSQLAGRGGEVRVDGGPEAAGEVVDAGRADQLRSLHRDGVVELLKRGEAIVNVTILVGGDVSED